MIEKARKPLRTSDFESAKPEWEPIGKRLESIRGAATQPTMAERLGVSKTTYGRWERGVRELGVDGLARLAQLGWNPSWVVTGVGPERFGIGEERAGYGSHELSEEHLTIALEYADRAVGVGWLPRPLYARLVRLLYDGVRQGLPTAQIEQFATAAARSMAQGGTGNGGESGLDAAGSGSDGGNTAGSTEKNEP